MNKKSSISFALLLIIFVIHIGRHVNDFHVPESDFFDFRDKAISLRQLQWPDHFKRPPLYAASIALFSALIPGEERELYAAEMIGVLSALAALFFFAKITTHFFGHRALYIVWLWALHPSTIRMAIKPKSEIFVAMFILWTFYLFIKKRTSAYATGFLASLVRYEGAMVIAANGIADFLFRKERLKTMALAIVAGLFIGIWTCLQSSGGDGESYFSYLGEYKPNFAFLKTFWSGLVGFMPPRYAIIWTLIAIPFVLGLANGWRQFRRETVWLAVFLIGFLTMHIIWPMPNYDYQVMIVWNALIFIGLGISWLSERVKKINLPARYGSVFSVIGGALLVATALFIVFKPVAYPQYEVHWGMLLLFCSPVVLHLAMTFSRKSPIFLPMVALTLFTLYYMMSDTNALLYNIRYSKAEFRAVGEWYASQPEGLEKMAVEQPIIVGYYAKRGQDSFLRLTDLKMTTPDQLHAWLEEQNVTYIVWMSANQIFATDDVWYKWKMENRGWKNIAFLADGKSIGDFTLVEEIKIGPRRAYIYKI
ncbi:hypothetical protein JW998_04800 [candidate division KSB1 bacterium]|nr:hypothetical protein [candidate division KSB1 bacterium]